MVPSKAVALKKLNPVEFFSAEERLRNKTICLECEYNKGIRCESCGCFLIALQKIKTWACPEGKF